MTLTKDQLASLTEFVNERIDEFGANIFESLSPGLVRVLHSAFWDWDAQQPEAEKERILEVDSSAFAEGFRGGYEAGGKDAIYQESRWRDRVTEIQRNYDPGPITNEAADAINRHNGVPGWRPGEEFGEPLGTPDTETVQETVPPDNPRSAPMADATVDNSPPAAAAHASEDAGSSPAPSGVRESERVGISDEAAAHHEEEVAWDFEDTRANLDALVEASRREPTFESHFPEGVFDVALDAPPKEDEKLTSEPSTHPAAQPQRSPVGVGRVPDAAAAASSAAASDAGRGSFVETDDTADAVGAGSGGSERFDFTPHPTGRSAVTLEHRRLRRQAELDAIIAALQEMSVDGQMPTIKAWDDAQPHGLPRWDNFKLRHDLNSWFTLAEMAGLRVEGTSGRRKVEQAKSKRGTVLPDVEEVIALVKKIAMSGVMPTMATFDLAKPPNWGPASAQMQRLGMRWDDLRVKAGLAPNPRERTPQPA